MDLIAEYYIHRSAEGYRDAGIYPRDKAVRPPQLGNIYFQNYLKEQNRIIGEIGDIKSRSAIVKSIENDYKKMLFGTGKEEVAFQKKAQEALNQLLAEKYGNSNRQLCGQVSTDNLLKVTNLDEVVPSEIEQILSKKFSVYLEKIENQTKISLTNLEAIVNELKMRIKELQTSNAGTLSSVKTQLGQDVASFSAILSKLTRIMNTVKTNLKARKASQTGAMVSIPSDDRKGTPDLSEANLQYINKLIDILNTPIALASANQQGDIGEWIAPMVSLMTTAAAADNAKIAKDVTVETLKEIAKVGAQAGAQGVRIKVDEYGQTQAAPVTINVSAKSPSFGVSCKYHRNKVDAEFTYRGSKDIEKASIKNYGTYNGLTLVSGTPLYNMLLYSFDAARFSAHYLNVMVDHSDSDIYFENYRKNAQSCLRMNMLNLALKGYDKSNQPTTFIVFNSKTKDVKCFDTTLLLQDLLANTYGSKFTLSNIVHNSDDTVSKIETDISDLKLKQNFNADTPEERMQTLIDSLRQQKLHISISIAAREQG